MCRQTCCSRIIVIIYHEVIDNIQFMESRLNELYHKTYIIDVVNVPIDKLTVSELLGQMVETQKNNVKHINSLEHDDIWLNLITLWRSVLDNLTPTLS